MDFVWDGLKLCLFVKILHGDGFDESLLCFISHVACFILPLFISCMEKSFPGGMHPCMAPATANGKLYIQIC